MNNIHDNFEKLIDQNVLKNINLHYKYKKIPKKKYGEYQRDKYGKIRYRQLLVPSPALEAFQKDLNELLYKIPIPDYIYGSIRKRNNIMNAHQHLNQKYFLTIDLKNFFSNISHKQIGEALRENHITTHNWKYFTKFSSYRGFLPQGAPSSPMIANIVFLPTAQKLFDLAKERGITFTSYLDDLSFSSKKDFKKLINEIIAIIKQGGFFINYSKIKYSKFRAEITGLIVENKKVKIKPEMAEKAKSIQSIYPYIEQVKRLNSSYIKQKEIISL